MSNITSLFGPRVRELDWTNNELAELYRVENALVQASIPVATERGVTDEGDPWFVFCRQDGQVLVHIARYDGSYHLFSPALLHPLRGKSFPAITKAFVSAVPISAQAAAGSRIAIHPAALLSLLVGAIFFSFDELTGHSGSAAAADFSNRSVAPDLVADPPSNEALLAAVVRNFALGLTKEPSAGREQAQESLWLAVQIAAVAAMASVTDSKAEATEAVVGELASSVSAGPAHPELNHQEGQPFALYQFASVHANAADGYQQAGQLSVPVETTALLAQPNQILTAPPETSQTTMPDADDAQGPGAGVGKQDRQDGAVVAADAVALAIRGNPSDSADLGGLDAQSKMTIVLQGGEHVSNLQLGKVETIDLIAAAGGGSLDLGAAAHPQTIVLSGDGELQIMGIESRLAPEIIVNSGSKLALSLSYVSEAGGDTGANKGIAQTLVLDGGDVQIQTVSQIDVTSAPLYLTVMSEGNRVNTISLSDKAATYTPVDITVLGAQALILNESGSTLSQTKLNAAELTGHLTVGVDLGSEPSNNGLLTLGGSNFVVGSDASIALVNLDPHSHIQLGLDLQKVLLQLSADVVPAAASLAVDLHAAGAMNPVSIGLISVLGVATLALNSTHAGTGGVNEIKVIEVPNASEIVFSGDSALSVGTIAGIGADQGQNITIDAGMMTGALSVDVSAILNNQAANRQIAIINGAGSDTFTLDAGGLNYIVTGLKPTDKLIVGDGAAADVYVNGANTTAAQQAIIDGQGNLLAAATMAGSDAGLTTQHQAVLFSYGGDFYIFIDAHGNHLFDAASDAIVKLTGLPLKDYAGVFYSH